MAASQLARHLPYRFCYGDLVSETSARRFDYYTDKQSTLSCTTVALSLPLPTSSNRMLAQMLL